ncbi:MAG: hypothetical protein E5299_02546 [Burkholderia gladioli]|nr:MAG: hypothetical protein E5299_02546 [Burkholderia gladioli]
MTTTQAWLLGVLVAVLVLRAWLRRRARRPYLRLRTPREQAKHNPLAGTYNPRQFRRPRK